MYTLLLPLFFSDAHATCGLDHCPMPESTNSPASLMLGLSSSRATDAQAESIELALGGTWTFYDAVQIGAWLPLVTAQGNDGWLHGTGNPLAFAAWNSDPQGPLGWGGGLQMELPLASQSELGDAHWMVLPYAKFWANGELSGAPYQAIVHIGWARALESANAPHGHHDHGEHDHSSSHSTASLIWPHTDNELQARMEFTLPVREHFSGGLRIDGIHEVAEQRTLVMSGIVATYSRSKLSTQIALTAPITDDKRLDYRATWRMSYNFPVQN